MGKCDRNNSFDQRKSLQRVKAERRFKHKGIFNLTTNSNWKFV